MAKTSPLRPSLQTRLEHLEKRTTEQTTRWLRSLSDEELHAVAGEIEPAEEAFLSSLTDAQLADCAAGRVSQGEFDEWRKQWTLQKGLYA